MRKLVRYLLKLFRNWLGTVPNPGPIKVRVTGEYGMGLKYEVILPQGDDLKDVVRGELTVNWVLNGESHEELFQTTLNQEKVSGLTADQDTPITLSFVYVDDAGNKSVNPVTITEILKDTFAPADPGSLGITVIGEE